MAKGQFRRTFTEDEIRQMVLNRAAPCAINQNSTGITNWCRSYGVAKSHVSEFLAGKREAPSDMLEALGVVKVYQFKWGGSHG